MKTPTWYVKLAHLSSIPSSFKGPEVPVQEDGSVGTRVGFWAQHVDPNIKVASKTPCEMCIEMCRDMSFVHTYMKYRYINIDIYKYIYISYMHIQSYTSQNPPAPFNSNSHNTHHHRSTSSNFRSSICCANQQPARSKAVQGAYTKRVVMHDPLREIPWLPRIRLESSQVRQRFRYGKKDGEIQKEFWKKQYGCFQK